MIDGGKYKDNIAARLHRANGPNTGSWMVNRDCDEDYAQQVTAEHKISIRKGNGKVTQEWKQKKSHGDNHYLDAEVYAMAAADILGVRSLHLEPEQTGRSEKPQEEQAQSKDWIQAETEWIGG